MTLGGRRRRNDELVADDGFHRARAYRLAGGISVICAEKCQAGVRVRNENAQREENGDFATNRRSLTRAANLKWANLLSGIF